MSDEHLEDENNNLFNAKHLSCDVDTDSDGVMDCYDVCPEHSDRTFGRCGCGFLKADPGICGCERWDHDSDNDGVYDCHDACPNDPLKREPGKCGCGISEIDKDWDGVPDCIDKCPLDAKKLDPGACGCGTSDEDWICWNGYAESLSYLIILIIIFVLGYFTGSLSLFGKRKSKQSILDRDFENNPSPRNPKESYPDYNTLDSFNSQSPIKAASDIRQRQVPAPHSPIYNRVPASPVVPSQPMMNPSGIIQPATPPPPSVKESPIPRQMHFHRSASTSSQNSDAVFNSPSLARRNLNIAGANSSSSNSSPYSSPLVHGKTVKN